MFINLFLYFYTIFCLMFMSSFVSIVWINKKRIQEIEDRLKEIGQARSMKQDHSLFQEEHISLIQEKQVIEFPSKALKIFLLVVAFIAIRNIILIEPLYLFGFQVGFIMTICIVIVISYIYNYVLKMLGVEI